MNRFLPSLLTAAALAVPAAASAQGALAERRPGDVSVSLGVGTLNHGDHGLGHGGSVGGSLTVPVFKNLAARFDAYHNLGPEPREQACGLSNVTCVGVARNGVQSMNVVAGSAIYYFGSDRIRPFVSGGLDVFHFKFIASVATIRDNQATMSELESTDTTMGVTLGAGVRVPIGERLVVTPEFRIYDGTMLAGANLGQMRTSVAIGYRW